MKMRLKRDFPDIDRLRTDKFHLNNAFLNVLWDRASLAGPNFARSGFLYPAHARITKVSISPDSAGLGASLRKCLISLTNRILLS
jgi:hypothetical protein